MTAASDAPDMRYDHILERYLVTLRAEVAQRTYNVHWYALQRAQREMPYGVIAAEDTEIQQWLYGQECGAAYIAQQDAAVRRLHGWLRRQGITSFNPVEHLPRPKQPKGMPRPVPDDQVRAILTRTPEPVRTWCHIAAYGGLRCCEIAGLDRADITPDGIRILGKGGKGRMVPMHPQLVPTVRPLPPGPVVRVRARDKAHAVSRRVSTAITRLGRAMEWPELARVTAHRLRHTIATQLLAETGDLRLVQEFLGHSSPSTTAVYTQVAIGRMAAAVTALPGWETGESPAAPQWPEAA